MGFLSSIFGGEAAAAPITAVGNVLDALFTSDEEKLDRQIIMQRLAMQPNLAQTEINKIEAGHRSLFVAGWRPAIGWICAIGLGMTFLVNPILQWATGEVGPELPLDVIMELVLGMLGLGALRTFEKMKGKTK